MRFEVIDRVETKRGLIFKKPSFECKIKIDLTDEEMEGLRAYCRDPYMNDEVVSRIHSLHYTKNNEVWDMSAGRVLYNAESEGGIYERIIIQPTLALREVIIEEFKDLGKLLKKFIAIGHQLEHQGSLGDTAEEL